MISLMRMLEFRGFENRVDFAAGRLSAERPIRGKVPQKRGTLPAKWSDCDNLPHPRMQTREIIVNQLPTE